MWRVLWFFFGTAKVTITGAYPEQALVALSKAGIAFRTLKRLDACTLECCLLQADVPYAQKTLEKQFCEVEVVETSGFPVFMVGFRKRFAFLLLLVAAIAGAIFVSKFVFFYRVEGNETVSEEEILQQLNSLGVGFGTYGLDIHPQMLRNQMLLKISKLKWLTVQQNGMCATVVVREREETEPMEDSGQALDVVAAKDGVITSVSCLNGNCLCKAGQAVRQGQVLVSAYTDMGFKTAVTEAKAEVYADTLYQIRAVTPAIKQKKTDTGKSSFQITLQIGQKRWNIFGNSSILGSKCDRIKTNYSCSLPGGYQIPISVEFCRYQDYDCTDAPAVPADRQVLLEQQAADYIQADMIAGKILQTKAEYSAENGCYVLNFTAYCEEMIARQKRAAILGDENE